MDLEGSVVIVLAKLVVVIEVLEVGSVNSNVNMLRNSTLHLFF